MLIIGDLWFSVGRKSYPLKTKNRKCKNNYEIKKELLSNHSQQFGKITN